MERGKDNLEQRGYKDFVDPERLYDLKVVQQAENEGSPLTIKHLKRLGLEQLFATYNVPVAEIPQEIERISRNLLAELRKDRYGGATEARMLGRIWLAIQSTNVADMPDHGERLTTLLEKLKTFSGFIEYLGEIGEKLDNADIKLIAACFDGTRKKFTSSYRFKRVSKISENFSGAPAATTEWTAAGVKPLDTKATLILDSKVQAIASQYEADPELMSMITKQEQSQPNKKLFHDTTVVALEGIGQAKSILSAVEIKKRGQKLVSGELTSLGGVAQELPSVHASSEGIQGAHAYPRYFNESPITFILNEDKQAETMAQRVRQTNPDIKPADLKKAIDRPLRRLPAWEPIAPEEFTQARNTMSKEEFSEWRQAIFKKAANSDNSPFPKSYESHLGPEVPLENVDAIAVPYDFVAEAETWVRNNVPHLKIIVREAAEYINAKRDRPPA